MRPGLKTFFRSLVVLAVISVLYSKMLGLPVALSIQSGPGPGQVGDLLVLAGHANTSERLVCVDSLASACTITETSVAPPAPRSYGVLYVAPVTATVVIISMLGVVLLLALRGVPAVYVFVVLGVMINGVAVGLPYIDQSSITLNIQPPPIGGKRPIVDPKHLVVGLDLGPVRGDDVTCRVDGEPVEASIVEGQLRIRLPPGVIEERMEELASPAPMIRPVPVSVTIPYSCRLDTDTGVLIINSSVTLTIRPPRVVVDNGTLVIENSNPIPFNVTIIIKTVDGTNVTSYTIPATAYISVDIPDNVRAVYVKFEYLGSTFTMRVPL